MTHTRSITDFRRPLIIAHRGYKSQYPENTLSSFRAALKSGVKMIEFDIGLSKDRIPVVIHDDTLDRTTDGKGLVSDFSLNELKLLDAGSWFSEEFKGESIPTLEEVLSLLSGKTCINIEIKPEAFEEHDPEDSIERQVIDLVNRFHCMESVIVSSFEIHSILRIGSLTGNTLATAFLTEGPAPPETFDFIKTQPLFSWNSDWESVTQDQIDSMHAHGINVFVYTVNDRKTAETLLEMGVDGIFSDDVMILS